MSEHNRHSQSNGRKFIDEQLRIDLKKKKKKKKKERKKESYFT
jgi:hypothetical protein